MRTAIVTDTNSGMSVSEGMRRGIYVLPMPIIIDGKNYLEGDTISFQQIFSAMEQQKNVSTSQPSPGDVCDLWDRLLSGGYDGIVYIPMSASLSSSYETARMLAEDYSGKVFVADNRRISLTLYESVLDAKAMADEGASAEEICASLEEHAYDATIYLTVFSLDQLRKSGRITSAVAAIGSLLRILPVMKIRGERLDSYAKVRGRMQAGRKMIAATMQDLQDRFSHFSKNRILVGAAGTLTDRSAIESWSEQICRAFPGYPFLYHPLSCNIACHTGPGAFGTGFVRMCRI